jgi:transcriptional regulator with XRE-family HTH domain
MIEENLEKPKKLPLRVLREKAGLTRPQVKTLIGVSERRQADWEGGAAMPSMENAAALARLYKVSLKTIYRIMGIDVTGIPDDERERSPSRKNN